MTSAEHMPNEDRLRELLVGKSIVSAEIRDVSPELYFSGPTGYLALSDGTVLKVWGNDGGCSCSGGCYPLESLNTCENVITNVEIVEHPAGDYVACEKCGKSLCYEHDYEHDNEGYYRIFVFAQDQRLPLASFEGSDGNGYYGTGWWLAVEGPAL